MEIRVTPVVGQCFPPTDRSPQYGQHGKHFEPYTQANLEAFAAGSDPMLEHSKLVLTATINDPKRGTGDKDEITREDVARLAAAGTPVGPIVFTVNGEKMPPTSANDKNQFNTRYDVTGTPSVSITVSEGGVTSAPLTYRTVTPDYPTKK